MTWLFALWGKTKFYALAIGAALAAAFAAYWRIREDGKNAVLVQQQRKRDELQAHYDEIDAGAPDLDAALDRLRRRAGDN